MIYTYMIIIIIVIVIIMVIIVIIIVVIIKYCYYTCVYIYIYVSPCLTVKSPLVGPTKSSPWGPHVWYFSTLSWLEKSPLVISPLFIARCFLCFMFNSPVLLVKSPFPSGEEKKRTQMWITCTQDQHPRTQDLHHVYTQESQEILSTRIGWGWGRVRVGWDVDVHWHMQTKDGWVWGGVGC